MTTYLSPGVYVKEVSSGSAPIAGAGTSTAAFIGVVPDEITIPTATAPAPDAKSKSEPQTKKENVDQKLKVLADGYAEVILPKITGKPNNFTITYGPVELKQGTDFEIGEKSANTAEGPKSFKISVKKLLPAFNVIENSIIFLEGKTLTITETQIQTKEIDLPDNTTPPDQCIIKYTAKLTQNTDFEIEPIDKTPEKYKIYFKKNKISVGQEFTLTGEYDQVISSGTVFPPAPSGEVKLCTNFNEFKKLFGDFSADQGQKRLAHAVYGFFNNGGTRCYVMRVERAEEITDALLEKLEAIDEIAIVAAPGITTAGAPSAIITHCQQKTGDRIAILDCEEGDTSADITNKKPANSNYAALYFPWIQVFDPATKTAHPDGDGLIYVPPSGHIAGIYARVDTQRGVHKAPANEIVLGALGLKQNLSKNQQDGLNPQGINCIRNLNGNIRVWGARTIGGDANGEFKYINVRRLFNYLKKSIDQGTQWTVFEPNSPELWAKIRRNVTAFLMTVWRSGALFGNTPEQAFYVKCDEETNPPELREQGQVITEIGVAIVKPAEFVIFNLSQWAGPGK